MSHPLDKLFKKKLQQRPFEMEEAHWLQALEMLEAQDKKRKRLPFWIWLFLPVALGSLVWTQKAVFSKMDIIAEKQIQNAVPTAAQQPLNTQSLPTVTDPMPQDLSATNNTLQNAENESVHSTTTLTEKGRAGAAAPAQTFANTANKLIDSPMIESVAQSTPAKNEINPPAPIGLVSNKDVTPTASGSTSSLIADAATQEDLALLPVAGFQLLTWEHVYDFTGQLLAPPVPDTTPRIQYPLMLGLSAGAGILPIQGAGHTPMTSFNGGLFFKNNFNEKWIWNLDLQYNIMDGDLPFTKENQVVQYSFNRQSFERRLQPNSLHYATGMFTMHRVFDRHSIGLGIGYSRLVGVRGMLTHYGAYTADLDTVSYNQPMWIKKDGFKTWNLPVHLTWQYQFSHQLSAQLALAYHFNGFMDENHAFPVPMTVSTLQPFSIEAGIRYYLFELKTVSK